VHGSVPVVLVSIGFIRVPAPFGLLTGGCAMHDMQVSRPFRARRLLLMASVTIMAAAVPACAPVKFVADYNQASLDEAFRLAKQVDLFYLRMIENDARPYAPFSEQYLTIEAELGGFVRRERARPLNSESTRIAQTILDFWRAYKAKHKRDDRYPDARFDRRRFERLFDAAVSAEAAKRLGPADMNVPPDTSSAGEPLSGPTR
jgi:hypothetical protein